MQRVTLDNDIVQQRDTEHSVKTRANEMIDVTRCNPVAMT